MPNVLIIGSTRGLGASLANLYASESATTVFGTTRSPTGPSDTQLDKNIIWVPNIDVSQESCGRDLVNQLGGLGAAGGMADGGVKAFDIVVSCTFRRCADSIGKTTSNSGTIDYNCWLFRYRGFCQRTEMGG